MSIQKVALITAGSAGLGASVARALAPDFRIAINYANNQERANSLIEELHRIPRISSPNISNGEIKEPRFLPIRADVGSKSAIESLVSETISQFGRLDVVVSNAGWTRITDFSNLDEGLLEEDWDKCFTYNVKSHLWLAAAAKPYLERSDESGDGGGGAFIVTASIAGVKPSGSSLPYAVTKAAAIHLSRSLAVICAPKIRVNSVSPGLLMTDWGRKFPEAKIKASTEMTKLKRLATVEDCAEQIRMLALNKSMTGQNIMVDGGASV